MTHLHIKRPHDNSPTTCFINHFSPMFEGEVSFFAIVLNCFRVTPRVTLITHSINEWLEILLYFQLNRTATSTAKTCREINKWEVTLENWWSQLRVKVGRRSNADFVYIAIESRGRNLARFFANHRAFASKCLCTEKISAQSFHPCNS